MVLFSKLYLYKSERESGELSGSVGTLLRLYLDGYLLIIVYIFVTSLCFLEFECKSKY